MQLSLAELPFQNLTLADESFLTRIRQPHDLNFVSFGTHEIFEASVGLEMMKSFGWNLNGVLHYVFTEYGGKVFRLKHRPKLAKP